jgi:transposase
MITWYGGQNDAKGTAFGSLVVVAPLLEQMGVADIIDQHLPVDEQAEFGYGTILSLLIAARVYSPVALSRVSEWAVTSGADVLWKIDAAKLNDDRIGRALDAFYDQRHSILSSLALHVAAKFEVPLNELHYDPTHVEFTGAYKDAVARLGVVGSSENGQTPLIRSDSDLEPAHITKGRAMDDVRKGTKMIHVGLGVVVDEFGPMPMCGHTIDGNQNGRTAVHEQTALLEKHLPNVKLTMISDRGTFSVGHLLRLKDAGCDAICSVPWRDLSDLFDAHHKTLRWNNATYHSVEQLRRRTSNSDLPLEEYRLAVLRHTLHDDEKSPAYPKGRKIKCRVIFVYSTADVKVVRQQRQKQIDRITKELQALQASVAAGRRNTDAAALPKRMARAFGTAKAAKYFSGKLIPLTAAETQRLGKPTKNSHTPTHRFEFTFNDVLLKADEQYDGYNAIVTTVRAQSRSADYLFTRFKQQAYSEQVNSQFKGPLAVRPVFLKSSRRIESLMFLLVIALMTYFLVQRTYRKSLPDDAPTKERQITTRTLLSAFNNYTVLVQHSPQGRAISPTRLTPRQQEILRRLNLPTPAQHLHRILPRPPD